SAAAVSDTASTLVAGDSYYYLITATDLQGESLPSQQTKPTNVNAGQAIFLSWSQVPFATGYKIYRGTVSGGENVLVAAVSGNTGTVYLDNGHTSQEAPKSPPLSDTSHLLSPGQPAVTVVTDPNSTLGIGTYFYEVTALSANGGETPASAESLPASITTANQAVVLSWGQVVGAVGYNIYQAFGISGTESLLTTVAGGANTTFTDDGTFTADGLTPAPGPLNDTTPLSPPTIQSIGYTPDATSTLTPGQTYYYAVTATDAAGETPAGAPGLFSQLVATPSNAITLSWNSVAGATGYNVYRGTTPGQANILIASVKGTSYTDNNNQTNTQLPPAMDDSYVAAPGQVTVKSQTNLASALAAGTTYFYVVTAVDSNGGQTLPTVERSGTVVSGQALVISWSAVPGAQSYNVYRSTASGTESLLKAGVTGTSFTDLGGTTSSGSPPTAGSNTAKLVPPTTAPSTT
ncbi:MAG: hypothetical protein ACREHD_30735, partial [Pirellulales bacterium]